MQSRGHSILILLLVLTSIGLLACSSSSPKKDAKGMELAGMMDQKKKNPLADSLGYDLYRKNCRLCHGKDGTKGLSGAKDLSISTMDHQERLQIIRQGKGTMKSYQEELTGQEIEEVARFIAFLVVKDGGKE